MSAFLGRNNIVSNQNKQTMSKYNTRTRRRILARFTECQVAEGNGLDWIFAKPLNWFDYDKLIELIHETERGCQMEMEEDELFTV